MGAPAVHRFHDVPDEDRWRRVFSAWRSHLQGLWDHLSHQEAPWAWSERTNVGLLASAHERAFPSGYTMAELPLKRESLGSETAGRFDLWMGTSGWTVHAEAKLVWAPKWGEERVRAAGSALQAARQQADHLVRKDWTTTVATLVFVVPYKGWTRRMTSDRVLCEFKGFADQLWNEHGRWRGTFQSHFHVPAEEIVPFPATHSVRPRAFPGVILLGRVHKSE